MTANKWIFANDLGIKWIREAILSLCLKLWLLQFWSNKIDQQVIKSMNLLVFKGVNNYLLSLFHFEIFWIHFILASVLLHNFYINLIHIMSSLIIFSFFLNVTNHLVQENFFEINITQCLTIINCLSKSGRRNNFTSCNIFFIPEQTTEHIVSNVKFLTLMSEIIHKWFNWLKER